MRFALLCALLMPLGFSQGTPFVQAPDCFVKLTFSASGQTAQWDNRTNGANAQGCLYWVIQYNVQGVSAVSIQVEAAQDSNGVPGSWSKFDASAPGTLVAGANPNTSTTSQNATFSGYFPWVRLNVLTFTASGSPAFGVAKLYGFIDSPAAIAGGGGGGGGGCTSPCPVEGTAATGSAPVGPPVYSGNIDGGGNVIPAQSCTKKVVISESSSGNTQIIALSGSTVIRLCHVDLTMASGLNWNFTYGTGSNCGTGTTALSGVHQNVTGDAQDYGPNSPLIAPAGNAVCLNLSAGSILTTGTVIYAQY